MSSNFQNSSGVDLDSIFFTDNSGGGAVGLQQSDLTDLGNKYRNGSVLGYDVGFQRADGVDLGRLRGTLTAPVNNSLSLQTAYQDYSTGYDSESEAYQYLTGWGYLAVTAKADKSCTLRLRARFYANYKKGGEARWYGFATGTSDPLSSCAKNLSLGAYCASDYLYEWSGAAGTSKTLYIAYRCSDNYYQADNYFEGMCVQIESYFYNDAGWSGGKLATIACDAAVGTTVTC